MSLPRSSTNDYSHLTEEEYFSQRGVSIDFIYSVQNYENEQYEDYPIETTDAISISSLLERLNEKYPLLLKGKHLKKLLKKKYDWDAKDEDYGFIETDDVISFTQANKVGHSTLTFYFRTFPTV
ncbi:hypothetical protein COEREDRAFT_90074 [Coemansia reversa NRRL 1564]|uniref:Uncharacterized protein n=1 Tax=Coemansia reversa (strain ATCC 12441 / NRRL 1564) TaxID=763665 RepID=A0A2G5B167_COERN|nr:hypothetical protein COEREDRAFT_90074 [Coemansia reversa NRRL 1564]|eukprot:PIA12756.1 hypothetical protein COEREDRAFT_90074 [Coemansia reversa NRRL 1564]